MRMRIREIREVEEQRREDFASSQNQKGFSEEALRLYRELMGYDEGGEE